MAEGVSEAWLISNTGSNQTVKTVCFVGIHDSEPSYHTCLPIQHRRQPILRLTSVWTFLDYRSEDK